MNLVTLRTKCALAFFVAGILTVGPAMADKPSWAGSDKESKKEAKEEQKAEKRQDKAERKQEKAEQKQDQRQFGGDGRHFQEQQHVMVREYYSTHYSKGRCPPGLAKKHNGCMPPGQAKKWQVGRPLPRDVVYYQVPAQLVVQIGPPPAGHRYVRVAGDILLLAIGTGMVVDAIQDLGGR
ncbi:MAG: RcnB family protein [Sulfuritalea sp.]|jgi:Ni/Co efflux regulator RcnB|nr:RcnB family protein [Sulfuritalea sp.]